jgi:hypothetical protein
LIKTQPLHQQQIHQGDPVTPSQTTIKKMMNTTFSKQAFKKARKARKRRKEGRLCKEALYIIGWREGLRRLDFVGKAENRKSDHFLQACRGCRYLCFSYWCSFLVCAVDGVFAWVFLF